MSKIFRFITYLSAFITFGILIFIVAYILINGLPHINLKLFEPEYTTENVSMLPAIINTIIIMGGSLAAAVPLGVFAAVFLVEYASAKSMAVKIISYASEILAGIPSIVYGLFGMLFFVIYLDLGYSLFSGILTIAIMILPLIMRTTQESLRAVPQTYKEASYGLGAGKLRTVMKIILPAAMPGIFSGIILSIGRIAGEAAALLYTAGSVAQIPKNLFSSGRTLAVHMYALSSEGLYTNQAFATAVVLLVFVLIINTISSYIAERINK